MLPIREREAGLGMAIVIMCGLGVGTVLTLGFVPVLYSLMFAPFAKPEIPRTTTEAATA